jgi:hypothetical protein
MERDLQRSRTAAGPKPPGQIAGPYMVILSSRLALIPEIINRRQNRQSRSQSL